MPELRNVIYEYFIDLKPWPCCAKVPNLLWINRQIRDEFGSLYLSQDDTTVSFDHLADFLRLFVLPPANLVTKDVAYKITVELCHCDTPWDSWALELVEVVSIMRHFPLLSIEWNLVPPSYSGAHDYKSHMTVVSILENMDRQEFEKLSYFYLLFDDESLGGDLDITLKSYCSEQDVDDTLLRFGMLVGKWVDISVEERGIRRSEYICSEIEEEV
ncbi:hypothetical protein J4E89_006902 [Alternaria sp. Ai002NY15]|nr:hypothetical protein J4E89_006902 [Alternaria sp. Ai002NY15]